MTWSKVNDLFVFKRQLTINKDIIDVIPSDIPLLRHYKGLTTKIEQQGELKLEWEDELDVQFYTSPKLNIHYKPFEINTLYVQLKYLNTFNGNKHIWNQFIEANKVVKQPLHIKAYKGDINSILMQLLPDYSEKNEIILKEWSMNDIKELQLGIFSNINSITLDSNLTSKLALLFVKVKRNAVKKEELVDCYKHFKSYLYDYILNKFTLYIKQYLPSFQFTTLEEIYNTLRLILALERTGLPMQLLPTIKSNIKSWNYEQLISLDGIKVSFYDTLQCSGIIGVEHVSIELQSKDSFTQCTIERKHTIQ